MPIVYYKAIVIIEPCFNCTRYQQRLNFEKLVRYWTFLIPIQFGQKFDIQKVFDLVLSVSARKFGQNDTSTDNIHKAGQPPPPSLWPNRTPRLGLAQWSSHLTLNP